MPPISTLEAAADGVGERATASMLYEAVETSSTPNLLAAQTINAQRAAAEQDQFQMQMRQALERIAALEQQQAPAAAQPAEMAIPAAPEIPQPAPMEPIMGPGEWAAQNFPDLATRETLPTKQLTALRKAYANYLAVHKQKADMAQTGDRASLDRAQLATTQRGQEITLAGQRARAPAERGPQSIEAAKVAAILNPDQFSPEQVKAIDKAFEGKNGKGSSAKFEDQWNEMRSQLKVQAAEAGLKRDPAGRLMNADGTPLSQEQMLGMLQKVSAAERAPAGDDQVGILGGREVSDTLYGPLGIMSDPKSGPIKRWYNMVHVMRSQARLMEPRKADMYRKAVTEEAPTPQEVIAAVDKKGSPHYDDITALAAATGKPRDQIGTELLDLLVEFGGASYAPASPAASSPRPKAQKPFGERFSIGGNPVE